MNKRGPWRWQLGVLALLGLLPALVLAQAPEGAAEAQTADEDADDEGRGYLTFYLDNDLFAGTDRNYTNGVRVSWISEGEPLFDFLPARRQLERLASAEGDYDVFGLLSGFRDESIRNETLELNYGLSLTQLMFTPADVEFAAQPPGERRYAGWLGLGFSVHARDSKAVNSVELILGTTGPRSLAEHAQDLVHDVRKIDKFQGWDDQIPNEVTLDLSILQKRRVRFLPEAPRGLSMDGLTEWGVRLGTFRTQLRLGGLFRLGFNLPADFSDPRLSSVAYSHRYFEHGDPALGRDWSAYILFGLAGHGIAHDATLDGPVFDSFDTGNTREPWVGEAFAGFGLRWQAIELSYVHTWRTREFEEAASDRFNFGTLALRLNL